MTADDAGVAPEQAAVEEACTHPSWTEEGDGHGHNHWRCADCGLMRWIAPWVTGEFK